MYINPFIAGILTVIVVEVLFIFVWGITHGKRVYTAEYTVTKRQLEEILEEIQELERKENESNSSDR